MSRLFKLWFATFAILVGATTPAIGWAQAKLHLGDDESATETTTVKTAVAVSPEKSSDDEENVGTGVIATSATYSPSKLHYADEQSKLHFADSHPAAAASTLRSASQRVTQPPVAPSANDPLAPSVSDRDAHEAAEYWFVDDECCAPRNWFEADYLLWWTKGNQVPALVSSSPPGTAQVDAGVLGVAGTSVLFGNGDLDDGERSGMRFTVGHWADEDGCVGLQATYFSVFDDDNSGDFSAQTAGAIGGGAGAPILARPFFNIAVPPNAEDSRLISFPAVVDGGINITSSSEMHSISVMLRQHYRSGSRGRLDLIGGYRYFRFREHLLIQESLVTTDPAGLVPQGTTYAIEDLFEASNDFHGGDMGVQVEFWRGNFTLDLMAKVALGNLHRTAKVAGFAVTDTPPAGGGVVSAGGLLAQPTNMGSFTSNDFAALPEFNINLKFEPREFMSVQVGYSLLFLSDIERTGDLIDRTVNATQLVGGALVGDARPASQFGNTSDFWAQGINFGVTFRR